MRGFFSLDRLADKAPGTLQYIYNWEPFNSSASQHFLLDYPAHMEHIRSRNH